MQGVVLLATYNEAASIRPVLEEIDEARVVLNRGGIDLEVFLIDDSSPDETVEIATRTADQLQLALTVYSGTRNGLSDAVVRGLGEVLAARRPDFIITMDADGQHDARQIPDLVRAHVSRKSAITIGSRWVRGGTSPGTSPSRTVMSLAGNLLARRITGIRGVADATTSFRVIQPEVVEAFLGHKIQVDGYGFFSAFIAIAQAHGYTVDEVPICFRPRYSGMSKLRWSDKTSFLVNLFGVRREVAAIRNQS